MWYRSWGQVMGSPPPGRTGLPATHFASCFDRESGCNVLGSTPLVDSALPADHDATMRRSSSHRLLSSLLLLILGALGTGLPSHSHGPSGEGVIELVAPDHHGHGVILTEQTDRIPTVAVPHAMPAGTMSIADRPVLVASTDPPPQGDLPHERAPPSASPRAPPLPI